MENQNPASVNRAHRHFIVDDEIVISHVSQAVPEPRTPSNQIIASLEASFMNSFARIGQPRNKTPSLTRREATVSEALREAELDQGVLPQEGEPHLPKMDQQPKQPQFLPHST
jgi:hypothetical protein